MDGRRDKADVPVKSRRRSRRGKMKSLVNARLNPNFDSKSLLGLIPSSSDRNQDELDPKTLPFDTLAKFLHPTFIFDYFYKILHFLKGDELKLCFPDLAPYKEAFLVKVAEDNRYLMSRALTEASVSIGSKILDVVYKNKNVFKWVHMYEDIGVHQDSSNQMLVYKKLDVKKIQNEQHFKKPQSSPPSPVSLASSLEDMSLIQQQDRQAVPQSFRIATLNATLKFIRNPTRLELIYPEMPLAHAQYVYSLIKPGNTSNTDLGLGFKSLHGPLQEALEELELHYEFKVFSLKTGDSLTDKILFKKIPKHSGTQNGGFSNGCAEHASNASLSTNSSEQVNLSKTRSQTKQALIMSLSKKFIFNALEQVLDFIEDKYKASLEFKDIDMREARFIECITSVSRTVELYKYFDEQCVVLLKRIARGMRRHSAKFKLNVGRLCKRTGLRTVTFHKTTDFDGELTSKERYSPSTPQIQPNRNGSLENLDYRDVKVDKSTIEITRHYNTNTEDREIRLRSSSMDKKSRQYGGIAFQSAGSLLIDSTNLGANTNADIDNEVEVIDNKRPFGRKGKLLEAMSTPLESDIAEKMMRRMGWEGGALGPRGEGITEPIIPNLTLASGAGLGHVKPVKTPVADFRVHFLSSVLSLLRSPETDTTVSFAQPLSKREARFIRPAISAFNNRKNIGLTRTEEVGLVEAVMDFVSRDRNLVLKAKLDDNKRQLHLTKTWGATSTPKTPRKKKGKTKSDGASDLNTIEHITSDHSGEVGEDLTAFIDDIKQHVKYSFFSNKAIRTMAYKMLFLDRIKRFVSIEKNSEVYNFDCILSKKQMAYVHSVVTYLNKKREKPSLTPMERIMYKDIRRLAGDNCYLTVTFDVQKFTLQKKHYVKRFTNSALDLPPPKSKDIKNTIIYTPNGIIKGDGDLIETNSEPTGPSDSDKNVIEIKSVSENSDNAKSDSDDDVLIIDEKDEVLTVDDDDDLTNLDEIINSDDLTTHDEIINRDEITSHDDIINRDENTSGDVETDLDVTKEDISLDLSNESMSLDLLDSDNVVSAKKNSVNDLDDKLKGFSENYLKNEVNNNHVGDSERKIKQEDDDTVSNSSKRSLSDSISYQTPKKSKSEIIYVNIVSQNDSESVLDLAKRVQTLISDSLNEKDFLPLLKCHGVQDGCVVYGCHSDRSCDWLKSVVGVANVEINPTDFRENYKLRMKIASFVPVSIQTLLNSLLAYNPNLEVKNWMVTDENVSEGHVTFLVLLDENSYKYICANSFSLYAGIDKVEFSFDWN